MGCIPSFKACGAKALLVASHHRYTELKVVPYSAPREYPCTQYLGTFGFWVIVITVQVFGKYMTIGSLDP